MAGGPVHPFSSFPQNNGRIYPNSHVGGTNSRIEFGMGVEASLGANSTWHLRFQMPEVLPSGTAKLVLLALAAATTGVARVNPTWASLDAGAGENPDTISQTAEGAQSITWGAGDSDDYKETKINLDADTIVAGEMVVMNMVFETASWTLAFESTWFAYIIWE